ncbi:MAG: hypothetical protein CMO81_08145 [Waddliaceae bacterium]|nr:hypothetical protein [Waddliaceae bacterium]
MTDSSTGKIQTSKAEPFQPKSKAKKGKAPKLDPGAKIETRDLFKTFLDADAGEESSQQENDYFVNHLKKRSKSRLRKIDRRIGKLRNTVMETEEKEKLKEAFCDLVNSEIAAITQKSQQLELELALSVAETLKNFHIGEAIRSKRGVLQKLEINGNLMEMRTLLRRYFSSHIKEATQLLKNGDLLVLHGSEGASATIKRFINHYVQSIKKPAK